MAHKSTAHVTAPLIRSVKTLTSLQNQTPSSLKHILRGFRTFKDLWLHDFCLPFFLLSLLSLPLGSRVKMGRGRGGHGPETALKPQPLFEWGCLLVHYWAFPSSCRQKRGMWKCILVSFLTFLFVPPPPWPKSLRVNTRPTCAKTVTYKVYLQVFLIFDSAVAWPLMFLFVVMSPFMCVCRTTVHSVHVLAFLALNTVPKSTPFAARLKPAGISFQMMWFLGLNALWSTCWSVRMNSLFTWHCSINTC